MAGVFEFGDPGQALFDAIVFDQQGVFWCHLLEGLEFCECAGQAPLLEGGNPLPAVLCAQIEDALVGIEAVQQKANGQPPEPVFDLAREAGEGLELTILVGRIGIGVFHEFRGYGESQAGGSDQLGFQDQMVVDCCAIALFLGETERAMPFGGGKQAGRVYGDGVIGVQETVALQHAGA